jgi:DME family drug/metabolite transporter
MNKTKSYLFVILGAVCWGFIGLFTRTLNAAQMPMRNIVAVRNFGAMALLVLIFLIKDRSIFKIQWKHLPLFLGSGLLSVLCLAWCYFSCQQLVSLAVAGILLYLAPSFVVIMSAILWKEPLTRRKIVALVLALAGCALVSGIVGGSLTISLKGFLLGVASGFCYATYTVFAHYALQHYRAYTVTVWTFMISGIASLPFADFPSIATSFTDIKTVGAMAGLVVIATVLPYFFYTQGLCGIESGKASIIASVEPVVGALIGVIVFKEKLTIWMIVGVVCVLAGVVLLAKTPVPTSAAAEGNGVCHAEE